MGRELAWQGGEQGAHQPHGAVGVCARPPAYDEGRKLLHSGPSTRAIEHPMQGQCDCRKTVRAAGGIESLVWLVDVAGFSREEARAQMRWSALALLAEALRSGPPVRGR